MARYSSEQKQRTYERILQMAGKLFREQGYLATGLQVLMKALGLTKGAFYLHFASKEALLKEVMAYSFDQKRQEWLDGLENKRGFEWFDAIVRRWISRSHRDEMGTSCPATTLINEVARSSDEVKETFESEVKKTIEALALENKIPTKEEFSAREQILCLITIGIGAITLARAVQSKSFSDQILKAARKYAAMIHAGLT